MLASYHSLDIESLTASSMPCVVTGERFLSLLYCLRLPACGPNIAAKERTAMTTTIRTLAVLLLATLSAVIGIIAALIRHHWGWAGAIVVCLLATGGVFAAIFPFTSASDPFDANSLFWVWIVPPLVC